MTAGESDSSVDEVGTKPTPSAADPEALRSRKPLVQWVDVCVDGASAIELGAARVAVAEAEDIARRRRGDEAAQDAAIAARVELERVYADVVERGAIVRFTFRSIGRRNYKRLLNEHPPTEGQQKEMVALARALGISEDKALLAFDAETFPPALMAAAAEKPRLSEEEARHFWDTWTEVESDRLFQAARAAQSTAYVATIGE